MGGKVGGLEIKDYLISFRSLDLIYLGILQHKKKFECHRKKKFGDKGTVR